MAGHRSPQTRSRREDIGLARMWPGPAKADASVGATCSVRAGASSWPPTTNLIITYVIGVLAPLTTVAVGGARLDCIDASYVGLTEAGVD